MITHCTECDTYFRVSIDQLKAANGQVKCGCCMTVFNAIESLLDSTDVAGHTLPATADQPNKKSVETMGAALLQPDEPSDLEEQQNNSASNTAFTDAIDSIDAEFEEIETSITLDEDIDTLPGENLEFGDYDQTVFEEAVEDDIHESNKRNGSVWLVSSLLLLGLLAFQFIKFNPDLVLAKFPQLNFMCGIIECPVEKEEAHDTSKINLVSRDVREHPQFANVLLVNATLVNSASEHQPFPQLHLDLFDKVGRPIGSRRFKPTEYLDNSVDLDAGMKPKLPVHIVLEVVGPGEEASSFEFKFL